MIDYIISILRFELNTGKKYLLFFLLFLAVVLSGCATKFRSAGTTPAGQLEQPSPGTLQNPYIKGKTVLPPNAVYDTRKPGTLIYNSPVVKTFIRLGWT